MFQRHKSADQHSDPYTDRIGCYIKEFRMSSGW